MENNSPLWLPPSMPQFKKLRRAKNVLHQLLIPTLQIGIQREDIIKRLKNLSPAQMNLHLFSEEEKMAPVQQMEWADSYEDCTEIRIFSINIRYKLIELDVLTDNFRMQGFVDVDSSVAAEAISHMKEKDRKIVADLLISQYVHFRPYLEEHFSVGNEDEENDTLHFDECNDEEAIANEADAVEYVHNLILDGSFDVSEPASQEKMHEYFNEKDLRKTKFPNEVPPELRRNKKTGELRGEDLNVDED